MYGLHTVQNQRGRIVSVWIEWDKNYKPIKKVYIYVIEMAITVVYFSFSFVHNVRERSLIRSSFFDYKFLLLVCIVLLRFRRSTVSSIPQWRTHNTRIGRLLLLLVLRT